MSLPHWLLLFHEHWKDCTPTEIMDQKIFYWQRENKRHFVWCLSDKITSENSYTKYASTTWCLGLKFIWMVWEPLNPIPIKKKCLPMELCLRQLIGFSSKYPNKHSWLQMAQSPKDKSPTKSEVKIKPYKIISNPLWTKVDRYNKEWN